MLIFAVTGTYLTIVDSNDLGLGQFGNFWGVMMLVKHLLIVCKVGIGFWFKAIMRVGPLMSSNTGVEQAISCFSWLVNAMAICGVVVLHLTALAQVEGRVGHSLEWRKAK